MGSRFRLSFHEHKDDPAKKAAFTDALFDEVAPRYDRFHLGLMSFFRDAAWKRWLVDHLPADLPEGPLVDLATGTGSIAFLLAEAQPDREIIGVDINRAMLARAEQQNRFDRVRFVQIDLFAMDFAEGRVALFTGGYALRNTPDLDALIAAMHRQLGQNGVAAFLDFSRPASPLGTLITLNLLRMWTGLCSLLLHGNLRILHYIPQSLAVFPDRVALQEKFEQGGFTPLREKRFLFGLMQVSMYRRAGGT